MPRLSSGSSWARDSVGSFRTSNTIPHEKHQTPRNQGGLPMAKQNTVNPTPPSSRSLIPPVGDRLTGGRSDRPASRFERAEPLTASSHEEMLVVDDRAALRPAQVVESKLTRLLQGASLPVSHLQMRGSLSTRCARS